MAGAAGHRWKKLGRIFEAGFSDWARTHVQNPFAETLPGGRIRVHFASRDAQNRARGGSLVIASEQPDRVLSVRTTPTLDLGTLGAFDDCGVMPSCLIEAGGETRMYYTGWSKAVEVPFSFHIGLAISRDGGDTFERYSRAPVLGRNHHDPYIVGAPHVLAYPGGFRMWYVSCTEWGRFEGGVRHFYTVKLAESADGLAWKTSPELCLEYGDEYAFARPFVFETEGKLAMYYSYRGGKRTYRVGLAFSEDGRRWQRRDQEAGIDVSPRGWDSQMICYATTFQAGGRHYMLYNGNHYGSTGLGLAVAKK